MAEETIETTEEVTTPEWAVNIEDTDLKGAVSKFESQQSLLDAVGFKAPDPEKVDWRESIKDDDAKKFAESSTDINHMVKRAMDLRKQVSSAIIKPGKDASDDQVVAYQKAMGIPGKPEEYEFPAMPEGEELTDDIKISREAWAARFHALEVPTATATALIAAVNEDSVKLVAAAVEADKAFAKSQEDALHAEWKGEDYDKNKTLANRAFSDLANRTGLKLEDLTRIETKDGRFLMDRVEMVKMFATIGREMQEGALGPVLTDSERETVDDQVREIRSQIEEAQGKGDNKRANQLYQKEQKLIAKTGNAPIVGAAGRAA